MSDATAGAAAVGGARRAWPASFFVLVSTEFAERFSYYGLRAILPLYLVSAFGGGLSQDGATAALSAVIFASYAAAVVGGWVADVHAGRFTTIAVGALVYAAGAALLALSAVPTLAIVGGALVVVALGAIAIGTGATKPCVGAFLGDQFAVGVAAGPSPSTAAAESQQQQQLLSEAFNWLYFTVNAGALAATVCAPLQRARYSYCVAFAAPALVMVVALALFFGGRHTYVQAPPTGAANDMLARTMRVLKLAARHRWRRHRRPVVIGVATMLGTAHVGAAGEGDFFDGALAEQRQAAVFAPGGIFATNNNSNGDAVQVGARFFSGGMAAASENRAAATALTEDDIADVRQMARVLRVLAPLPLFWALFDQHATRWVFQAMQLDRTVRVGPHLVFQLQPDQMPMLNPVFTLLGIVVFARVVYPTMRRARRRFSRSPTTTAVVDEPLPLIAWRLVPGMLLTALAFALAGALQLDIDAAAKRNADNGVATLSVLWQLPQYAVLSAAEILVSVTCMELAYREAPQRMKSVTAAAWLLTTSLGSLINLATAHVHLGSTPAADFFAFATLMLVNTALFAWVNRRYRPATSPPPSAASV